MAKDLFALLGDTVQDADKRRQLEDMARRRETTELLAPRGNTAGRFSGLANFASKNLLHGAGQVGDVLSRGVDRSLSRGEYQRPALMKAAVDRVRSTGLSPTKNRKEFLQALAEETGKSQPLLGISQALSGQVAGIQAKEAEAAMAQEELGIKQEDLKIRKDDLELRQSKENRALLMDKLKRAQLEVETAVTKEDLTVARAKAAQIEEQLAAERERTLAQGAASRGSAALSSAKAAVEPERAAASIAADTARAMYNLEQQKMLSSQLAERDRLQALGLDTKEISSQIELRQAQARLANANAEKAIEEAKNLTAGLGKDLKSPVGKILADIEILRHRGLKEDDPRVQALRMDLQREVEGDPSWGKAYGRVAAKIQNGEALTDGDVKILKLKIMNNPLNAMIFDALDGDLEAVIKSLASQHSTVTSLISGVGAQVKGGTPGKSGHAIDLRGSNTAGGKPGG